MFFLKGVLRNIDDADVLSENFCESLMNQSREEKKTFSEIKIIDLKFLKGEVTCLNQTS